MTVSFHQGLFGLGVAFFVLVALYGLHLRKQRVEGKRPPIGGDLLLYVFGVLGVFCCIAAAVSFVPHYYELLGGRAFLGNPKEEGFDAASLATLLTVLTGVPVALAGSVYAILLARRADQTATEQLEAELERRLSELTRTMTKHFAGLVDCLLSLHAAVSVLFEDTLRELPVALTPGGRSGLAGIARRSDLRPLKREIKRLRHLMSEINGFEVSAEALRISVRQAVDNGLRKDGINEDGSSAETLGAVALTDKDRFRVSEKLVWFDYAEGKTSEKLVDALEVLRLQSERLTRTDLISAVVRSVLDQAASLAESGKAVDPADADLFFRKWIKRPSAELEENYYVRLLGRMLLTREALRKGAGETWLKCQINYGAVILEDLARMIPTRQVLENAARAHSLGKRLDGVNKAIFHDHMSVLPYAGAALFPQFFRDGMHETFGVPPGADPLVVLRVPHFGTEVHIWVSEQLDSTSPVQGWDTLVADFVAERLVERAEHITRLGASREEVLASFDANEHLMEYASLRRRWNFGRAHATAACQLHDLEKALALAQRARSIAEDGDQLERSSLDLGDILSLLGRYEASGTAYAESGSPHPRDLRSVELWLQGFIHKFPDSFSIEGQALLPEEIACADGLLPILIPESPLEDSLELRPDSAALVDVVVTQREGCTFPTYAELARHFCHVLAHVPGDTNGFRSFDPVYRDWAQTRRKSAELSDAVAEALS